MRPTTTPITTTALSALIAALPTDRLAELILTLANGGASTSIADPPPDLKPTRRQRKGWPRGKLRGPRRAMLAAAAKAEAKAARSAERKRAKRAEARALREAAKATTGADVGKPANDSNGDGTKKGEAAKLWNHAAKMDAKSRRVVANEFNLNKQQTLDAFRQHTLPPGVTADAIERFLELPIS